MRNKKTDLVKLIEKEKKSWKIVLLKRKCWWYFTKKGKDILKNVAADERMINCNKLFLKTGDPIIKNYDFLKSFGTLHDLLLDLLSKETSTIKALIEQNEIIENIKELKDFILLEEKYAVNKNTQAIKKQGEKHKEKKF